MTEPRGMKIATLSLHAGQRPDPATGARAVPIYQTTSFVFEDTAHAASLFNLERPGHIYSRISNPTVAVLEERVAAMENGVGAMATASGQAALFGAIATLMGTGGHIVASASLYGGSVNLLKLTLPRFGITTTFVDPRRPALFREAIRPQTRLVFAETLSNAGLEVLDIAAVAEIAHAAKLPLMLDATMTPPTLCRSFDWGCDIVMHSATKWMGGHGVAIGGIVVDSGRFDWMATDGMFPTLTEPYAGYHGITFAEEFGPAAFAMRARAEGMRDFGPAMAPATAFYILQGIETLPLRMERHVANAHAIVAYLQRHPAVAWASHPDLPEHPDHALAKRQFPKGAGSMVSFGVKGGRAAGAKFINALRLVSHLANLGDAKTLAIHPASTTHQQLDAEAMKAAKLSEDLIRLSVGLEDPDDIKADLDQALKASQR
ncbi:MAG: O-acetylhomoserine aminocarboxypropyltransferase [Alphaproteobacteria bacterium]|nr:O-acetylhomoserine aminocarboxypropyltransferase [Alphaproteobacteria bacterium]